ncbi:MAG: hypothetical protein HQ559_11510 [Lentisphaerae bacterium]|nr:hypothetical protein [Lentisphaerota bacterium]
MNRRILLVALGSLAVLVAAISCRRSDLRTAVVDVPGMDDARAVRIVTNATLDEVVGQFDGNKNAYEVDLSRKIVVYHESRQRLLSREYQRHIRARIAEVGFDARVIQAGLNPPPPVQTVNGLIQTWPNRFTAVISVPDMGSATDANVVVDAIAYARIGRDDPRVNVSASSRRVMAAYESIFVSLKNIEYAIACAGFDANRIPAKLGEEDALPHGWTPVSL